MSFHNGSVAHPQERYLSETIALTAALLLGRKRIFADYLTKGRRRAIVAVFTAQQLLIFLVLGALHLLLVRSTVPGAVAGVLYLALIVPATAINLTVACVVLRRFKAATSDALRWPTKPAHDGVYVYDIPLHGDLVTHLHAYLRLGVARDWDRTVLARKVPRLYRSELPDLQHSLLINWTWRVHTVFEPQLFGTIAFVCFLTLNFCWVYFFAAGICLGRSEEATRHWFDWEGRRRFANAEAEREAAAERQREKEAREAEARRRDFVAELPGRPLPDTERAAKDLPRELRDLIASEPPLRGSAADIAGKRTSGDESAHDDGLFA